MTWLENFIKNKRIKTLLSAKRFLIATLLYLRGDMIMSQLRKATGLSWGDLESNIRTLEEYGIVVSRKIITLNGPRTIIYLTPHGIEAYEQLASLLRGVINDISNKTKKSKTSNDSYEATFQSYKQNGIQSIK